MAKYELMQKTETNGEIWYFIRKEDGIISVENSWTKNIERAEEMLEGLKNGKPSEPIFEILKTIEVDENKVRNY